MEPGDVLLTLAEIALGLLGFGGLVGAFAGAQEEGAEWLFRRRLAGMLGAAVNALILSLLPLYWVMGDAVVPWGGLSMIQAVELISWGSFFAYGWWKAGVGNPVLGSVGCGGAWLLGAYEAYNFFVVGGFQIYLAGLLFQIVLPAILFARMAQVILAGPNDAGESVPEQG